MRSTMHHGARRARVAKVTRRAVWTRGIRVVEQVVRINDPHDPHVGGVRKVLVAASWLQRLQMCIELRVGSSSNRDTACSHATVRRRPIMV